MFYTYYKQWGRTIMFSYIDDNGKLHHTKVNSYEPTLYLKTDEESEIKSIFGYNLKPIKFNTINEARDFIKQYKDVDGMTIEGNSKYANQFTIEICEGKSPAHQDDLLRGLIIDIEVSAPEFPKPEEAKYPVDSITVYDTIDKRYTTLSLYDYDQTQDDTVAGKLNVDFTKYDTEDQLLMAFVNILATHKYNFTSGWHSTGFDFPYLVTRITSVLGKGVCNRMSPYGIINTRIAEDEFFNKVLTVDIIGLPDIDYMLLYKKHIYEPRENYRLGYIAEVELGTTKLSYEEEGTLANLSKTNPQKYTSYNIIDVDLIRRLEDKLGLFALTFALSYYCIINYDESLATVAPWEALIAKELYNQNMAPLAYGKNTAFRNYPGGYVASPQVGYHEWVFTEDLNSLYPHIEMQIGISPETHIPRKDLSKELQDLQDLLSVKNSLTYYNQCMNLVKKEVDLSVLKKYNYSMSANGQFYRKDIKGIVPQIKESIYEDRKVFRRDMREYEQLRVDIEYEMKKRGIME